MSRFSGRLLLGSFKRVSFKRGSPLAMRITPCTLNPGYAAFTAAVSGRVLYGGRIMKEGSTATYGRRSCGLPLRSCLLLPQGRLEPLQATRLHLPVAAAEPSLNMFAIWTLRISSPTAASRTARGSWQAYPQVASRGCESGSPKVAWPTLPACCLPTCSPKQSLWAVEALCPRARSR